MRTPLTVFFIAIYCGLSAQAPVDSSGYISVGGIEQFVSFKGLDSSNPLLIFLHGGPGGSAMSYSEKFTHKLQQHFVVVQWDQRETGKTLVKNPSQSPLSLGLFENDTHELIIHLLQKFNQQKIYLMGHSWGTVPGFHIAKNYPELLYAYIPVCPMINQTESENIILLKMKEKAVKTGNAKALVELNKIKVPFKNGEQLYYHRKWVQDYNGSTINLQKSYVQTWAKTWLSLFNEASATDLNVTAPELFCPIYFFVGRQDLQTNSSITEAYYKNLVAPKKGLFWFEHSGHFIPSSEPYLLQDIIIEKILPETLPAINSTAQTTN